MLSIGDNIKFYLIWKYKYFLSIYSVANLGHTHTTWQTFSVCTYNNCCQLVTHIHHLTDYLLSVQIHCCQLVTHKDYCHHVTYIQIQYTHILPRTWYTLDTCLVVVEKYMSNMMRNTMRNTMSNMIYINTGCTGYWTNVTAGHTGPQKCYYWTH